MSDNIVYCWKCGKDCGYKSNDLLIKQKEDLYCKNCGATLIRKKVDEDVEKKIKLSDKERFNYALMKASTGKEESVYYFMQVKRPPNEEAMEIIQNAVNDCVSYISYPVLRRLLRRAFNFRNNNDEDKIIKKALKNKGLDEDLTNLPPIPDKVKKKLGSPIPRSKEEKEKEMSQPGTFQRYSGGQRFNKISENKMSIVDRIIKEEINRLFEEKSFRVTLRKKYKENKLCEKCHMPENACKCTENSTSFGPKTMLDKEVDKQRFEIREVAIVKDKKSSHIIMKDSLGGISCDCEHYLKEHINGYCKHIKKYLIESPIYNDNEFRAEQEGKTTFFFDNKTNKPVAFYNERDKTIKKYPETNQELYDGQQFTIYAQRDRRLQASLVKFLNALKGKQ